MRASTKTEIFRVAALAGTVLWILHFLVTAHLVGGTDARGYSQTMIDALEQARSGHWPVFVGQGEWQWNGAVHPFRTAPYFLNLGIVLDLLTGRSLTPLGVEHLVLIFSGLQAVLLTYILLVRLEPGARWQAWIAALCWWMAPLATGYVVNMEMYMTVMTFGWLPLVLYGNARIIRNDDGPGWACLAAGLALTWMSHAAVAAWASLITAVIQGLRLLLRDFNWPAWRNALGGALLFSVLAAFYFCSIGELSPPSANASLQMQLGILALAVVFAAGLRLLAGGTWHWCWPGSLLLGELWLTDRLYFNWAAGFLLWSVVIRALKRGPLGAAAASRALELAVLGAGFAAVVAVSLPFSVPGGVSIQGKASVDLLRGLYPANILPISGSATALADLQLGYLLWAGATAGCLAALWRGTWEARCFALTLLVFAPLLVPIPGLTTCLYFSIPDWLYGISALVWYRVLPPFSFLIVFTAYLALTSPRLRSAMSRRTLTIVAVIVAGGLAWDAREMAKLQKRGNDSVNSADQTRGFYRTDSAALYFCAFLPPSGYSMAGVMDYHLESRLLKASDLSLLPEPLLEAPNSEEITLTSTANPFQPAWQVLAPKFTLAPHEREIWKFEFFNKPYEGWLVAQGSGGYNRYYRLPFAGDMGKSFGVAKDQPKTLAFWNSLDVPQNFELTFMMNSPIPGFGDFAKVKVQRYRPEELQIQTLGLIPYRARVKAHEPSFLETPRGYIQGYRARVDGRSAKVEESPDHLAMVRLEPGMHEIAVTYSPTAKLTLAGLLSAGGWLGLIIFALRRSWAKKVVHPERVELPTF